MNDKSKDKFLGRFLENRINLYEEASLDTPGAKMSLISTIPRSGTWSHHYFWSVYDALAAGLSGYDPFPNFYVPKSLNTDIFGVTHFFCPGWQEVLPDQLVSKLQNSLFPGLRGVDWASPELEKRFGDVAKPHRNPNCRIVLVYRNPLDQLASYFRQVWNAQSKKEVGLNASDRLLPFLVKADESRVYFDTMKDFLRGGALNSYCIFLKIYLEMAKKLPGQIHLEPYERIVDNRELGFKTIHDFFDLSKTFNPDTFGKALKLTEKESLSNFERSLGHSINYEERIHADRPKNEITKHIYSTGREEWRHVFDRKDIDYTIEILDSYGIDAALFQF
ncbi:MAG: sulfotransferase domain-containing protein [Kordiimonadaceae bacterium]|nr:sulfotransferase domain-containing protein [Kordiimonadaceae bacterium]